ncbi:MAG: transposase [Parvularculaceae bacterium]
MPNYRRLYVPGGTYFFTVNLQNRRLLLLTEEIVALRASWADILRLHPFETIAVVVLPDHMHFVWALPDEDADFSTRIRLLKSGFTRRLDTQWKRAGRKGERKVWQRRFWEHAIRDEDDLERHIAYIHFNPVKHGHVADPDDWPHSSWHGWKREFGRPTTISPDDWRPAHLGEA